MLCGVSVVFNSLGNVLGLMRQRVRDRSRSLWLPRLSSSACGVAHPGFAALAPSVFPRCEELKERTMPHVIVKLYPGRSEQQQTRLAEEIVKDVVAIAKCGEESVSVAIEEIQQEDWAEKVYKPGYS